MGEMMRGLSIFYFIYVIFFLSIFLAYDLSAFLTVSPLPTPSFLFYTHDTSLFFLDAQLIGIPSLFVLLYILTREGYIMVLVVMYSTVLILFIFLHNIIMLIIFGIVAMCLFLSVVPQCDSLISKVLWGISSFYLLAEFFTPFSIVLLIPSFFASGIEILSSEKEQ
jgi:hypothetical protein